MKLPRPGTPRALEDALRSQAGFSLLEALVASLMSVLVVGGMLLIFDGLSDVHRDQQQLMDAQMTARLALEQMKRDIQLAGIGLRDMLAPHPIIEPRVDGGVDVHYTGTGGTARLMADMSSAGSALTVDDESGFESGMAIVVYDGTGSFDLATIGTVTADTLTILGNLSKAYQVSDGAAVKRVQTISYSMQAAAGGGFDLQRREDANSAHPVATNVRSLSIAYFDDSTPPQPFNPVSVSDQYRVRAVEVTIVVETEDVRLNTTAERTVTLTTRITPRAVQLAS